MGFLDRLLGREEPQQSAPHQPVPAAQPPANTGRTYPPPPAPAAAVPAAPARSDDEIAVERYRYLLRTAPPETIEQVHEEAFTKLTPEQRQILFTQLSENAPAGEQPRGDDPRSLAQAATRSEIRQPGTLERSFNGANRAGGGQGMGFGGMVASSLLGTVAGYVIGSALVSAFLPAPGADQAAGDNGDDGGGGDAGNGDNGDNGGDSSGDNGGTDAGGDAGGDGGVSADGGSGVDGGGWGDSGGGDWSGGAGDFGGGDFGGGDFGGGFDF